MTLFLLAAVFAFASPKGMVVRLESGAAPVSGPVVAVLSASDGPTTRIPLNDDGTPPDVTKGDDTWAGASWFEGDTFTVEVETAAGTLKGDSVSWKGEDTSRDLVITVTSSGVTLAAGVAPNPSGTVTSGASTTPEGGSPEAQGGSPSGSPSGLPSGAPSGSPAGSQPGSPSSPPAGGPGSPGAPAGDDGTLYIALGVGLLALSVMGWFWLRSRSRGAASLEQVAEPPLLGPGTPSLSKGLFLCVVPPEDRAAALSALVRTSARHHRVIVVGARPEAVFGGPVFHATDPHPAAVGDAAEALVEGGGSLVILLANEPLGAPELKEWTELWASGAGGIALVSAAPSGNTLPVVTLRRDGNQWIARGEQEETTFQDGPRGLEPLP